MSLKSPAERRIAHDRVDEDRRARIEGIAAISNRVTSEMARLRQYLLYTQDIHNFNVSLTPVDAVICKLQQYRLELGSRARAARPRHLACSTANPNQSATMLASGQQELAELRRSRDNLLDYLLEVRMKLQNLRSQLDERKRAFAVGCAALSTVLQQTALIDVEQIARQASLYAQNERLVAESKRMETDITALRCDMTYAQEKLCQELKKEQFKAAALKQKNDQLRNTIQEAEKSADDTGTCQQYSLQFENDISSLSLLRYVLFSADLQTSNKIGRLANEMRKNITTVRDFQKLDSERLQAAQGFIDQLYRFYCSDFPVEVSQQFIAAFDVNFTHVQGECFGAKARADILSRYKQVKLQNQQLKACLTSYIARYGDSCGSKELLKRYIL